jgi:hypothetical protein
MAIMKPGSGASASSLPAARVTGMRPRSRQHRQRSERNTRRGREPIKPPPVSRRLDGLDQDPGREWLGQIGNAAGVEGVATDGLLVTRRDKYHRHRMPGSCEPAAQFSSGTAVLVMSSTRHIASSRLAPRSKSSIESNSFAWKPCTLIRRRTPIRMLRSSSRTNTALCVDKGRWPSVLRLGRQSHCVAKFRTHRSIDRSIFRLILARYCPPGR